MEFKRVVKWLRDKGVAKKAENGKQKQFEPPFDGEDEKAFMARCMHHNLKEKSKELDQSQAICLAMWERRNK